MRDDKQLKIKYSSPRRTTIRGHFYVLLVTNHPNQGKLTQELYLFYGMVVLRAVLGGQGKWRYDAVKAAVKCFRDSQHQPI